MDARAPRPHGGFTLLELMAALVIFSGVVTALLTNLDWSTDLALGSVRARELRVLAERKLGEVTVFEREFDDLFDNEDFDESYGEQWDGWEWSLFIRDVVIFGETSDENAEYLFGAPEEDDEQEVDGGQGAEPPEGETQYLRELTLTVRAPTEEGEADAVTIVTFLPLVQQSGAVAGSGTPPAPGAPGGQ